MVSLAVSASSSDAGCDASRLRRYAFSTSLRVIVRPSTTAHVSAEITGAGFAAGVARQAMSPHASARGPRVRSTWGYRPRVGSLEVIIWLSLPFDGAPNKGGLGLGLYADCLSGRRTGGTLLRDCDEAPPGRPRDRRRRAQSAARYVRLGRGAVGRNARQLEPERSRERRRHPAVVRLLG